jgi:hypothetical protein
MLEPKFQNRITIEQIKQHDWYTGKDRPEPIVVPVDKLKEELLERKRQHQELRNSRLRGLIPKDDAEEEPHRGDESKVNAPAFDRSVQGVPIYTYFFSHHDPERTLADCRAALKSLQYSYKNTGLEFDLTIHANVNLSDEQDDEEPESVDIDIANELHQLSAIEAIVLVRSVDPSDPVNEKLGSSKSQKVLKSAVIVRKNVGDSFAFQTFYESFLTAMGNRAVLA